jgi:membrane associated rhomboid family serine protease
VSQAPRDLPAPKQPIFNAPPGALWTCGALVVFHLLFVLAGPTWQETALRTLAFIPARFLALFAVEGSAPSVVDFVPLLGHAFLHADVAHLLLNASLLLAFGSAVERRLGSARFAIIFAAAAVAGALAELTKVEPRLYYVIGASGSVYGMMGAAIPIMFRPGLPSRRRRALEFIAVIMALNLIVAGLGLGDVLAGAEIAWRAHIGGLLAGLLLGFVLAPRRRKDP